MNFIGRNISKNLEKPIIGCHFRALIFVTKLRAYETFGIVGYFHPTCCLTGSSRGRCKIASGNTNILLNFTSGVTEMQQKTKESRVERDTSSCLQIIGFPWDSGSHEDSSNDILEKLFLIHQSESTQKIEGEIEYQSALKFLMVGKYQAASPYLKEAARKKYPSAYLWIGICLENGYFLPKNEIKMNYFYKKAVDKIKWFMRGAEEGDADANNNLGYIYKHGIGGIEKNEKKAVECFQLAADREHAIAQLNLGLCYKQGRGVLQDYQMAMRYYRMSANQGNKSATDALNQNFMQISQSFYSQAEKNLAKPKELNENSHQSNSGCKQM